MAESLRLFPEKLLFRRDYRRRLVLGESSLSGMYLFKETVLSDNATANFTAGLRPVNHQLKPSQAAAALPNLIAVRTLAISHR